MSTGRECCWRALEDREDRSLDGWTAGGAADAMLAGLRAGGFVVLPVADAETAREALERITPPRDGWNRHVIARIEEALYG